MISSEVVVNIAGPLFICLLLTSVALGVLTAQVFLYHIAFPTDAPHLKLIVWSVYILEVIQTILITYSLFQQFVYGFLDGVRSLDRISWNWLTVPILGGMVAFIVQSFYVHRIVVLGRFLGTKRVPAIALVIVIISVIQLITGIIVGVELQQAVFYSHIELNSIAMNRIDKTAGIFYGTATISDSAIAVCMTIILVRSSTHIHPITRKIVRRLVRLTIEAGSLTAAMSIITIILVIVPTYEPYYQPSSVTLSKLYSIAMMAFLLNRVELSNGDVAATSTAGAGQPSTLRFPDIRYEASGALSGGSPGDVDSHTGS